MASIYIKDYDTTVEVPEGSDMAKVQEALAKQFPSKSEPSNWKSTVSNIAHNVLPSAGAIGGGVLASPGIVSTPAGGVLGYAAGEAGARGIDQLMGLSKDKGLVEEAKTVLTKDIPSGVLQEAIGIGTGKAIGKGYDYLAEKFARNTPETIARIKLFEEQGIPYTPADATQSKGLGLVEGNLKRGVASADTGLTFEKSRSEALEKAALGVQEKIGGKMDMLGAGQTAQASGRARQSQFMAQASKLYKEIPVDPTTPVETAALRDAAIGHIDELGKIDNPSIKRILNIAKSSSEIRSNLEDFAPENLSMSGQLGTPSYTPGADATFIKEGGLFDSLGNRLLPNKNNLPTYTWQELLSDQSALRKASAATSDWNKKRVYNNLVNAINDDIANFSNNVSSPSIKTALDNAVKFYKEGDSLLPGIKTFRDQRIANVLKTNSPEDIVNGFIKPNNVSDIKRLSQVVGTEGMKPVKQSWIEKLITSGEEQTFSPAKFATAFEKYDSATLGSFLSKEEIQGLRSLAEVSRLSGKMEKLTGNPSGTAQIGMTAATVVGFITHPIKTTLSLVGSKKFAELYFNNHEFRKTLIYGSKMGPTSRQAIEAAAKLGAIAGIENSK